MNHSIQFKNSHIRKFIIHFMGNIIIGLILVLSALLFGMMGYRYFEKMSWIDAFVNAAMILSGMGPLTPLYTTSGKIFAGSYALFSGLVFIVIIALIFSPLIHYFFRKIHLESKSEA